MPNRPFLLIALSGRDLLLKRLMGGILRGMEGASELRRRAGCAVELDELLSVFSVGMLGRARTG